MAQVKTADKSNEITPIPELLDALDIKGSVIIIDAMGYQHSIAEKIIKRGADYVATKRLKAGWNVAYLGKLLGLKG